MSHSKTQPLRLRRDYGEGDHPSLPPDESEQEGNEEDENEEDGNKNKKEKEQGENGRKRMARRVAASVRLKNSIINQKE